MMNNKTLYAIMILLLFSITVVGCSYVPQQTVDKQLPAPGKPAHTQEKQMQPAVAVSGVPVLMYHCIGNEAGNDAVISPERFAEQMAYLYNEKYNPITLDELADYLAGKGLLPQKPVVLTFDDGYQDTYDIAMPLLKRYNFKSTVFIPVGEMGKRLTWQQLKEMKASGMAVESHSYHHSELGNMATEQQREEIISSKRLLDGQLGQDTKYFCYPNGSYSEETLKILQEAGFKLAVTINSGWAKPGDNVLLIKRVWVGNSVDLKHFKERLTTENYSIL